MAGPVIAEYNQSAPSVLFNNVAVPDTPAPGPTFSPIKSAAVSGAGSSAVQVWTPIVRGSYTKGAENGVDLVLQCRTSPTAPWIGSGSASLAASDTFEIAAFIAGFTECRLSMVSSGGAAPTGTVYSDFVLAAPVEL